jgi:hypothetical protein
MVLRGAASHRLKKNFLFFAVVLAWSLWCPGTHQSSININLFQSQSYIHTCTRVHNLKLLFYFGLSVVSLLWGVNTNANDLEEVTFLWHSVAS